MKFVACTLAIACAHAQQPLATPQKNGPAAAVTIKSADGNVTVIATPLDPPATPRTLWQGKRDARILARIDDHQILLQRDGKVGTSDAGTLHVLDTRSGMAREVAKCWWREVVDVHDDRLVYLDTVMTIGRPLMSLGLQPDSKPRRIGTVEFVRRSPAHGNQVLAIEAEYRGVWKIDLRRDTCERLFEPARGAVDITLDRSPAGQRIVLGIARYDGGEIVVLDASSGKVVRRWSDLQIRSTRFVPELPVAFVDDDTVASIETGKQGKVRVDHWRVTRSLTTGKELSRTLTGWPIVAGLDAERMRRKELLGETPSWPAPQGSVLRQLRAEPNWLQLSPDAKHAIVQREEGSDVELLGAGAPIVLGTGTILACRWLPALSTCTTDHNSGRPHTRYSDLPIKK